MSDLSPYICTVEECSKANIQYSSIKSYLEHGIIVHELRNCNLSRDRPKDRKLASIKCPFCGLQTAEGKGTDSRGRHVGRHFEEIAFLVAPKAYEDWEFYSDSSSSSFSLPPPIHSLHGPGFLAPGPHKCDRINPSTGKQCNRIFSRPYDLTRHQDTIHNRREKKVRCNLCTSEKTFSRNDALVRHFRIVHPDVEFPTQRKGQPISADA